VEPKLTIVNETHSQVTETVVQSEPSIVTETQIVDTTIKTVTKTTTSTVDGETVEEEVDVIVQESTKLLVDPTLKTETIITTEEKDIVTYPKKGEVIYTFNQTTYEVSKPKIEIVDNQLISITTIEVITHKVTQDGKILEHISTKTVEVRSPFTITQTISIDDPYQELDVTTKIQGHTSQIIGLENLDHLFFDGSSTEIVVSKPKIQACDTSITSFKAVSIVGVI